MFEKKPVEQKQREEGIVKNDGFVTCCCYCSIFVCNLLLNCDFAFQNRYKWIQKHSTPVMTAGKSQKTLRRMEQIVEAENGKLCFEGCTNPVPQPAYVRD